MTSNHRRTREEILEAALEHIRRHCTTSAFGGWHHDVARIADRAIAAAAKAEPDPEPGAESASFVAMEAVGRGMVRLRADTVVPMSAGAEVLHVLGKAGVRPDAASPTEPATLSP